MKDNYEREDTHGGTLCPFKRTVDRETNGFTGKQTMHERFEVCAGSRCMAYSKGKCLRLKMMEQPMERRR